uniref:Uncharacterized protein n=1 Tax=Rhizophagus irregularis (strain DAOM 181602 / DAOM 197198 / MUCL 43194) TaxID=747089 RepID=U9UAK7_RHIID
MANETVTEMKELQDRNKYLEDENANLMMMLEEYEDNIELLKTEIQSLNQKNDDLEVEASNWDENEIDDLVVEVCSFPMIYKPDDDGDKVCTPAKVFPRHFIKKSLTEECMDVIGNFMKMVKSDDNSALSLQVDENEFEQTGSANSHVSN